MCIKRAFIFLIFIFAVDSARVRHHSTGKQALKFLKGIGVHNKRITSANGGLWPSVFNLATKALISVNATCGEGGREEFCRMSEGLRGGRCGICDNFSPDLGKRHPINYAIDDGTNRWWQSPPLYYGEQYEHVTITLDLKQVYQVAYVIIKAANSPRPGAWILERSIDGENYDAWQYFATSDKDCLDRYGIPARKGKPHYFTDSEVICTSFYSKLVPMENGEIHTFLIHGRPGANETSPELLQFTKARYVRLRLQGLRGRVEPLPAWLSQDIARDKRLYYSIRDISVGGQCVCNGHASSCRHNVASGHPECECLHHTCGPNCEKCCPLFNQRLWGAASSRDSRICLPCNCHGHAKSCHYDEDVDKSGLSMDINGYYQGGGVCDNCTGHTTGINCEKCKKGYFRPIGVKPDSDVPCVKCDCDTMGSTGHCEFDGSYLKCECKVGYTGLQCDECANGYKGYPNCEVCPCDQRGVTMSDCEGDCVCKANVDGKFCNHCKPGYFSLQSDNPKGCLSCFCSGVTSVCGSAHLPPKAFSTKEGWLISDISVTEIEEPAIDDRDLIFVGNYEIPGIEAYYFLAPQLYLGNKLETYGSELIFKVHWVVMRGDTSGKPTTGPNIIIVGANGMRIASGDDLLTGTNATFTIKLAEYDGWYHVPNDVKDIVTRLRRTEYKGDPVTRAQFLNILMDIKYILLRAKYHTDQIEGYLEEAVMQAGNFQDGYSAVEECSCPSGYTGLSCESCQYGYVSVINNTTSHQELKTCIKCDCNGHSSTCNPETGECFCEHNTIGESCERCGVGYYGNPLLGTPGDCKKCACPLEEEENNFSPSCQLDSSSVSNDDDEPGYVCTQCPKGYTGDHCEICDDGYFGIPSIIGGKCEPCLCGGGPCDRITGQCLGCRGNTEGWRCERCKPGYFGDPIIGCEGCLCDPLGSIKPDCNNVTGECECKEHFIGRTCNKCEIGYGNVSAHCTPCDCNMVGSKSNVCDPHSGLCDCQSGVEGFHCDACQHLHYGFSKNGCESCKCNPRGSELKTCDIVSGQCRCKPLYTGRTCDTCEPGYWDSPDKGCIECNCDPTGSFSTNCDVTNGNCKCRSGITGKRCNTCKTSFYGFSSNGCKACDPCNKKGHICHPNTGKCVCTPFTHGSNCDTCVENTWGYEPNKGCKPCNCSEKGSIRTQCNLQSGICACRQGYRGAKCDQCEHGYYGYPKCRRCSCSIAGTDPYKAHCDNNGICQCNPDGSCHCKENVSGGRCTQCKDGTFDLDYENPYGCTKCFCFGRSTKCSGTGFTWGKNRAHNRTLQVELVNQPKHASSGKSIDYSNFEEIEGTKGDINISSAEFDIPIYWKLPEEFNKDQILSYGGYLRFTTKTFTKNKHESNLFKQYPLIQIEGNGFKLIHHEIPINVTKRHEIRIQENFWNRIHNDDPTVTRELLMITLQNISGIYIKATNHPIFSKVVLEDVSLDTAIEVSGNPPPIAKGVEKCECPKEYDGTSCQNPSKGYFRQKSKIPSIHGNITSKIDAIIGKAVKCQCNHRSEICDTETGDCLNCKENTSGKSCEECAEGFYGNPMEKNGICRPCECPSSTQNNAISCTPTFGKTQKFICFCKEGYKGKSCENCDVGYFRNPDGSGNCIPCNCNIDGSVSKSCDFTGKCQCKPGITGKTCSQCEESRHILHNQTCEPCDHCTQMLLDEIEILSKNLYGNTSHLIDGVIPPPWEHLDLIEDKLTYLNERYLTYLDNKDKIDAMINSNQISKYENETNNLSNKIKTEFEKLKKEHLINENFLNEIYKSAMNLRSKTFQIIDTLHNFGKYQISTKEAVERGNQILIEIDELGKKLDELQTPDDVFKKCTNVKNNCQNTLRKYEYTDPKAIFKDLTNFTERINDLQGTLSKISDINNKVSEKNIQNEKHLEILNKTLKNENERYEKLKKDLKQNRKYNDETKELFKKIQKNYDDFLIIRDDIDTLMIQVKEKEDVLDENINKLEEFKEKIDQHTKNLSENITNYMKQFKLSTNEIKAVNASQIYQKILEIFNEANKTLSNAEEEFKKINGTYLQTDNGDSIFVKAEISKADSERLLKRVKNINPQLNGYREQFNLLYRAIEDFKAENWQNGIQNNAHSEKINQLLQNPKANFSGYYHVDIDEIIKNANRHSEEMRQIYKDAANINLSMQYDTVKYLEKILNITSEEKIEEYQERIENTRKMLHNIRHFNVHQNSNAIKNVNVAYNNFLKKKDNIDEKLENLRASIKKAEHISSYIHVPLTGNSCSRSYKVANLEPSITLNIQVIFNPQNSSEESSLLFLRNEDGQYVNLKYGSNTLIFSYKFSTKSNTLKLENLDGNSKEISVTIKRDNNKVELISGEKSTENDEESVLFNVSPDNHVNVGMSDRATTGLSVCIYSIIFMDNRIGLWHFVQTEGECTGCNRQTSPLSNVKYNFNGNGYVIEKISAENKNPTTFSVELKLKTFDENALLFLAFYDDSYMSIHIKDGLLICKVHYKNPDLKDNIITSEQIYNNGKEVAIECSKGFKDATDILKFVINGLQMVNSTNAAKSDILKIRKSTFYLGGVPPDFPKQFRNQSFLGLMYDIQFASPQSSFSLGTNQYYGVDLFSGNEVSYKEVAFGRDGYLHLKTKDPKISSLSFVFRTDSETGLILKIENIIFELENGEILIKYNLQNEKESKTIYKHNDTVNDDSYHFLKIEIDKSNNMMLFIDQKTSTKDIKVEPIEQILPIKSDTEYVNLYIGGVKGGENHFVGVIKDITINNREFHINSETYMDSRGARIGRSLPFSKRKSEISRTSNMDNMGDMQHIDSCDKVTYNLESNAAHFDHDGINGSYVVHNVKDFWKNNYKMEFEFRTFHNNGLLFFANGPKDHYNLLQIKNEKIEYTIKAKKSKSYLLEQNKVNDGIWHHVTIEFVPRKETPKKGRLYLSVDGEKKKINIRQNKMHGNLYFGGVPNNIHKFAMLIIEPFRGCIRELKYNNTPQDLIHSSNTVDHKNIGQCFAHIERGAYFRGDSYVIYRNDFLLHNFFEASFEFRTSQQNGVLLSVSNQYGSPALSIELQNGAVVMSVDMGNGAISFVTNNSTKFTICNNTWHQVKAIFSTELTVIVDGVESSWVLSSNGFDEEIKQPLYVGGLPDTAPDGTLKIRENFLGCIRNLKINNEQNEWIDMYYRSNISLNSCPTIS